MGIHAIDRTGIDDLATDLYATTLAGQALPKRRLADAGVPAAVAYALVRDELILDGSSRQNLATFCTTWMEPEVRQLMADSIDKNMIDKDEYPQTAEVESRCVHILADLWHAPAARRAVGCSTTGSSEAAMLGGLALKWRWRQRRLAAGLPADRPNLVCGPVQVCWEKFARYFDVELRSIPLEADATGMRPHQLAAYCDERTIGVVPTLGVTFTGVYEPVADLAAALDQLQRGAGIDVPMHVDAASGGFVAPFAQPELDWDFRIPRVKSINASGHKYGMAPLGVGWIVWRDAEDLPDQLIFRVDYLGGDMPTFALNFSRPGGAIIAQYYNFLRLGRDGYRRVQQACIDSARFLAAEVAAMGPFALVYDGQGGLPAIAYTLSDPDASGFSLYDLSDRVRMRGWQIASYPLPANRRHTVVQRILVRHGVSRDMVTLLAADLRRAVQHLHQHPVPRSDEHRAGHHH
jgi:glutamate decarboxylase